MHISPQTDVETGLEVGSLSKADHLAHRETNGIVVDLFWSRGDHENEFRVEVEDMREGAHFVLHPTTGKEAIDAFHHPFSPAGAPFNCSRRAA
jgi:hypothetical protein